MSAAQEPAALVWERECAVAVMAGQEICPAYHLPCWVCWGLHLLTGTVRSVTHGRLSRFHGRNVDIELTLPWCVHLWDVAGDSDHWTARRYSAIAISGDGDYWTTRRASATGLSESLL